MTAKNNLIIYNNFIEPIKLLSNEDAGILFKKLVAYHFDNTETKDNAFVEFAFGMMKPLIDENKNKYENICKRNVENGSKGGRPKGNAKTQKTQSVNSKTQENPEKLNRIEEKIIEENIIEDIVLDKPKTKTHGTRFNFMLHVNDNWYSEAKRLKPSITDIQIKEEMDKFNDYWSSLSGSRATKVDWLATWRNWIRSSNQSFQQQKTKKLDLDW